MDLSNYETFLRHPMLGSLWEAYVVEDLINALGDEYQYFFYRTADGAECDLVVYLKNRCIAAVDAKFSPQPHRTKSMSITIQDLKPLRSFYAVPDCPTSYSLSENQFVATPWQIAEIVKSM